ncbi:MAG: hypothetical protein ACJA1I_000003 [Zhongshania marina]|jgi:hypothetical protein
MITRKRNTETYVLTDLERLDPVTVYVTNYEPGRGKIVIECYGEAWTAFWGGMSGQSIQKFITDSHNDYVINKMVKNTSQTDFDEIEKQAKERGYEICATNDVEIAMQAREMSECFGSDWFMDLPTCSTPEYCYLSRILDAVKAAFQEELQQAA